MFLKLHAGLERLRNRQSLGAWLFQAARNAIADHHRSRARRKESPAGDVSELAALADVAVQAEAHDQEGVACATRCLEPLVRELPAGYRSAIRAVELEGLTQREAAARAGLSWSGMKARVQRARARLRAMLVERCGACVGVREAASDCAATGCKPQIAKTNEVEQLGIELEGSK